MEIQDQRKRGQDGVSTWCNELVVFLVSGKLHEGQCSEYMGTYNVPYYSKAGKSPQAAQAYHIKEIAIWKITLNQLKGKLKEHVYLGKEE